ncbi:LPD1 domain-containing protein, partial [Chitinimonas sp. PSY-7]
HEMFARAFETWVMDKLANNEASNHYLVSNNKRDKGDTDPDYPYPAGEERKVFNQAFERLISELKVQESEGGPLLYSRSDDHKAGDSGSDA